MPDEVKALLSLPFLGLAVWLLITSNRDPHFLAELFSSDPAVNAHEYDGLDDLGGYTPGLNQFDPESAHAG